MATKGSGKQKKKLQDALDQLKKPCARCFRELSGPALSAARAVKAALELLSATSYKKHIPGAAKSYFL